MHVYDASATWSFNLASAGHVDLGLLNMTAWGGGFDSLTFKVTSGSSTLLNQTFTSLATAQVYFTDHPIDLGSFGAGTNTFVVDYALTAGAPKGADVSYLLSALTPAAQQRRVIGVPAAVPAVRRGVAMGGRTAGGGIGGMRAPGGGVQR